MRRCASVTLALLFLAVFVLPAYPALQGFIKMQDGYFVDSVTGQPWVPHGIAYQTWNRPLGVWQTFDQIDYDLDEMVKMGANSIRVDFVWQHIEEQGDNIWSWTNYDYLIQACEKRDLRIFALVGYQWPPNWFPDSYYTMHPPGLDNEGIMHTNRWQSDIINYEHPSARAQYSNFLYTVCARYKNSKAIAGWVVGNEYGYLGLWSLKYDGYDPNCEAAFRTWCTARYTAVTNLNKAWGSGYTSFNQIVLSDTYEWKGTKGAEWADMVQWHEDSIASFTAAGARGARAGNTNHLLSYSTVGMQWGEEDWRYHAEDRGKIARACASNNAALSFFCVNNYPWAMDGSETRNGQWGISFTKKTAGMPVVYSETGFTSSETLFPGMTLDRQGWLIRNALWECLEAGGIGAHVFSWQDRPWITDREKGFGILYGDRSIKPAFWTTRETFNLMEQVKIADLLKGSADPKPDIAFLWDDATDSQYIRFENEMQHEAGALERLGYEPSFILGLGELQSGAYTNYKAIILPRNMRVSDTVPGTTNSVLNFLLTQVLTKGIHVIAVSDLPGMQDRWGKPRAAFSNEISQLFGIDASDVGAIQPAGTMSDSIYWDYYRKISIQYNTNAPAGLVNYTYNPSVWKYNDRVRVNGGTLWAKMDAGTNRGYESDAAWAPGWNTWGNVGVRQWGWQYEGSNMVQLWGWAGMWQNFQAIPGHKYTADAYLRSNSDDGLSNGTFGVVMIEWYDANTNLISSAESPRLTAANNAWQSFRVSATAPSNVVFGRTVRKLDRATNAPIGSLYFDADTFSPAVVAKSHGAGKAVIILHSLDTLPDGNGDSDPDTLPYKWRSDILGSILQNYCGVQPLIKATGTNAYLCLPEYRTCTNGAILVQVKNYLYNRYAANGGSPQTFTIQSSLFNGKTIRAFEQGRIIATNSNGTITLTLQPDGQEMLYAYAPGTNRTELVQIKDAPAVLHPLGDKVSKVTVKFDCRATTGLKLKVAFKETGDNGDGTANEIYAVVTNAVSGAGETNLFLWIPDYNQKDSDYKSTPDGGKYEFASWLETAVSQRVAEAVPAPTALEWGVRPTAAVPTNLVKGATYSLPVEWEDLYEPLYWRNTPLSRNSAFPTRVALFRSSKTESQYPGQFTKVNAVCDWLQTLGYSNSNPLDVSFDNVTVVGKVTNNFEAGNYSGWLRTAGCANWNIATNGVMKVLRAWRIGNSDNILVYTNGVYTNATVSMDVRYNKQDHYFSDAELLFRYVDRNNHYKIGIRNYYGVWHVRYLVKAGGQVVQQGWLYDFPKTNQPVENMSYNLKVEAYGSTNKVYFNNQLVGTFWATNFASGKIALGTHAEQLGIWEPQKACYFIDDDENGMTGQPLNLDWGYLQQFFSTLVLPSTYVMNDIEASNVVLWATNGLHSIVAIDGGIAMKNETGAFDLGRLEKLFGVGTSTRSMSGINRAVLGTREHYVTLDYAPGTTLSATGAAVAFSTLAGGVNLGTTYTASNNSPAILCNVVTNNAGAPAKVFCFNYGADTYGQLTNQARKIAQRAFEWVRNDAFKLKVSLMYMANPANPAADFTLYTTNIWVLTGSGSNTVSVKLPTDGIMTGTNLYWLYTIYPWDASDAWATHAGFYSSGNEGVKARLPGTGLQIFGVTDKAFAGRDWDMWAGYNTLGTTLSLAYGIKDKGATQYEDNFNDGNYTGWNIVASPRIAWSVSNNSLQARVASVTTGGYSYIYWNGLAVTGKNITIEYSTTFTNGALDGGVIYGGRVLYVNPNLCGWADNTPNYFSVNRPTTGKWHRVVVQIRDGSPYLLSDLFVDNKTVFLSEPIQVTSWTTNTVGFLSPYSNLNSIARWDNVRIADEQYSVSYTNILGEKVPTNSQPTFWPGIPDYDPAMWEHDGTTLGASYEWYVYLHGEGVHSYSNTKVYFAPRLRVELATFPTNLTAGTNVVVPVEWENLPTNSAKLRMRLFDAYSGLIYVEKTNSIAGATGNTNVAVTVPTMPAGSNYVWSTFIYLNNSTNPWGERIGSDDTFRFDDKGIGVEPETMIRYVAPPSTGGFYNVYSDGGIPVGASILTWQGAAAYFNGDYTGITPPEGTKCFMTTGNTWQGWGVFKTATDMRTYSNGYLKFWVKSSSQLEVDLEAVGGAKWANFIPTTTNNWVQKSLPISGFGAVTFTNLYGLFEVTAAVPTTFYVDDVRWSLTP